MKGLEVSGHGRGGQKTVIPIVRSSAKTWEVTEEEEVDFLFQN